MGKTKEYYSWCDIKKRVSGKTAKYKRDYVDRGIKMHQDFECSFSAFYKEVGPCPEDGQKWSIGRIDNNKDYTYGNLRWETPDMQARNRTKRTDNTTGVTGVYHDKANNCIIAACKDLNKNNVRVRFSLVKYTYEEAFRLACEKRIEMIEHLNLLGAGYSETHGDNK